MLIFITQISHDIILFHHNIILSCLALYIIMLKTTTLTFILYSTYCRVELCVFLTLSYLKLYIIMHKTATLTFFFAQISQDRNLFVHNIVLSCTVRYRAQNRYAYFYSLLKILLGWTLCLLNIVLFYTFALTFFLCSRCCWAEVCVFLTLSCFALHIIAPIITMFNFSPRSNLQDRNLCFLNIVLFWTLHYPAQNRRAYFLSLHKILPGRTLWLLNIVMSYTLHYRAKNRRAYFYTLLKILTGWTLCLLNIVLSSCTLHYHAQNHHAYFYSMLNILPGWTLCLLNIVLS
jgi:hypothetical protein